MIAYNCALTDREISGCLDFPDFGTRVKQTVALIATRLSVLADKEPSPDLVVCAMPKDIEASVGPDAAEISPGRYGSRSYRKPNAEDWRKTRTRPNAIVFR